MKVYLIDEEKNNEMFLGTIENLNEYIKTLSYDYVRIVEYPDKYWIDYGSHFQYLEIYKEEK